MRTTLTIQHDAASVARHYAEDHGVTFGMAVSILIRQGHAAQLKGITYPAGFEPFPYRPEEPLITTDHVKRLQEELP